MGGWVQRHPLAYITITVALILAGWEGLASRFTVPPPNPAPLETLSLSLYDNETNPIKRSHVHPRLLILGNSQVHYVRDREDGDVTGFPAQLARVLRDHDCPVEIADLSAGGQQVVESLAILIDTMDRVRPDQVVLGLGLANMRGTTIPQQLVTSCDWERIRQTTTALTEGRVDPVIGQVLLQLYSPRVPEQDTHDPTIQEQLDQQIAGWLADHSAAVRHRSVMSQWVTQLPGDLEREVRMAWKKQVRKQHKARTYDAGPNYSVSLAAVQLMAAYCRERQIPFTVVSMPFYPDCDPIVYVPADEQQLDHDLQQLVDRDEIMWLDLSLALLPEHFGQFQDGSIDGLHFLATGHARLAETAAPLLRPQLSPRVADHVTSSPASRR